MTPEQLYEQALNTITTVIQTQQSTIIERRSLDELARNIAQSLAGLLEVGPADLAAACDTLGEIMLAMQARKLLARGVSNAVIAAKMQEQASTDEKLGELAASAFEKAAMTLANAGYPGATVHTCGVDDLEER